MFGSLSLSEAEALCTHLISGAADTDEIRDALLRLKNKGETAEEIAGFSKAIVSKAQKSRSMGPPTIFVEPVAANWIDSMSRPR